MTQHKKWIAGETFSEETYLNPSSAKFTLIIRFDPIEEGSTSAVSVVHVTKTLSMAARRAISQFQAVIIISATGTIGIAEIAQNAIQSVIWTGHKNFRSLANALDEAI